MKPIRMAPPLLLQLPIVAFIVLGLVSCGGGGGGNDGWIEITEPSPDDYYQMIEASRTITLSGNVFETLVQTPGLCNVLGELCSSTPGYDSLVSVELINETNGIRANLSSGHCPSLLCLGKWSLQAYLSPGINSILVVAQDTKGNRGTDRITINVPKLPNTLPTHFIPAQVFFSSAPPTISTNYSGDAVVIWEDWEEAKIYAATYNDSEGWSPATAVSKANNYVHNPKVSMDQYGNALAIWDWGPVIYDPPAGCDNSDPFNDDRCIVSSNYKPGLGWSEPLVIPNSDRDHGGSDLVMDEQGNALVFSGNFRFLTAFGYDPVSGWSQESENNSADLHYFDYSNYISDNNGGAIAVGQDWPDYPNGNLKIIFSTYTWDNGWSPAIELGDGSAGPRIALSSSGNMVVAWAKGNEYSGYQVRANYYSPDSGWSGQKSFEAGGSPAVGIDASGNALVIWLKDNRNRTNNVVRANNYIPGLGWGISYDIGDGFPGDPGGPSLVMSDSGIATAVWTNNDGFASSIVGNKYNAAMGWNGAEIIELDYLYSAENLRIEAGKDGKALVAWQLMLLDNSVYRPKVSKVGIY